ncbi:hypothetical protein ADK70_35460 [Streptomyces rimosus subsp. pseudoverticillatus]|nr:hypothetical protein ADK70_35460 [Streptomyces rimosus subsp. pseudoverticillatus]
MPRRAPCSTTAPLNPASTHAFVTVGALLAVLSSMAMPMALSCTLAATTSTAMTRPITSVTVPLLRPGLFLPGSSLVISFGTLAEARTVCESITMAVGPSCRRRICRACQRSRSGWFRRPHRRARARSSSTPLAGGRSWGR